MCLRQRTFSHFTLTLKIIILQDRNFFTIFTDFKPLIMFVLNKNSEKRSSRQHRQLDFMLQFFTNIQHVNDTDYSVASVLS